MKPSLPQDDPGAAARGRALAQAKETYLYDRSIAGLLFAKEVPLRDRGGVAYWAKLAAANAEVKANRALTGRDVPDHPVETADDYARAYRILRDPSTLGVWATDEFFAWRAVAGDYPCTLTRLTAPLGKLPLTPAQYARVAGEDVLTEAIAEGRLYVVDHARFDGARGGQTDGYDKFLDAPIGVYAWTRDGRWVVVGIQSGQDPATHRFFQPGDGVSWRMAKTAHACADSQVAGLMGHFGLCHVVVEAIALATPRCLAPQHPLRLLLDAHTENTLIVNEITKTSLTPPDGAVDRSMSMSREDSLALTLEAVQSFRIMDSAPPDDFARRGVDDVEALPVYPYRDDQLLLWRAISTWVEAYVRTYYADDAAVAADRELADFASELEHPDRGGLAGIGEVLTVDRLAALIQRLVFRCSGYHAAINYALYDEGYAPLEPTAQFAPGPTGEDTEEDYLRMLPPYDLANEVIEAYYPLQVRINRLGGYDELRDPAVAGALAAYRAELEEVEAEIVRRNQARFMPYTHSLPSQVSNSVHV